MRVIMGAVHNNSSINCQMRKAYERVPPLGDESKSETIPSGAFASRDSNCTKMGTRTRALGHVQLMYSTCMCMTVHNYWYRHTRRLFVLASPKPANAE